MPIPGAGIIGKVADVVSNAAEDGVDEMDAIDDLADLGDEADAVDAVAPVVAGLAIKKAIPTVSRLPHTTRKQLVKAATAATKHIARRHGPAAAAVVPAIVHHARKIAVRRGASPAQLPNLVRKTAARVAQSPQLVRRLAQTSRRMRAAPGMGVGTAMGHRRRRRHGYGGFGDYGMRGGYRGGMRRRGGGSWGAPATRGWDGYGSPRGWDRPGARGARGWGGLGGARSLSLSGPVRITIESM